MRIALTTILAVTFLVTACKTDDAPTMLSGDLEMTDVVLHCHVAKNGAERQNVVARILSGAEVADEQALSYAGHQVSVVFNKGSATEPQQLLTMRLDERTAQVYDPTQSLYKIGAADGVELQCYPEYGVDAPSARTIAPTCFADKNGANRQPLTVTTVAGAQTATPVTMTYGGHKLSVTFNKGSEFDGQQSLAVGLDGAYQHIYDPGRSLYKFTHTDGTQVQCHFGVSVVTTPPATGNRQVSCTIDKNGALSEALTVQHVTSAADAAWEFRMVLGHKVAVRFIEGDQFEGQQLLWIRLSDRQLKAYDPTKSLYHLGAADGVKVQCFNESGPPPAKQSSDKLVCSAARNGNDPVDVPPLVLMGGETGTPGIVQHSGHKFIAKFYQGDEFDSQQLLWLESNKWGGLVYDPGPSLTVFEHDDGTALQCSFPATGF